MYASCAPRPHYHPCKPPRAPLLSPPPADSDQDSDNDRPLDRTALEARVHRAVARKAEQAVKIRAVRPAPAGKK